jgi:hypothetical protein
MDDLLPRPVQHQNALLYLLPSVVCLPFQMSHPNTIVCIYLLIASVTCI